MTDNEPAPRADADDGYQRARASALRMMAEAQDRGGVRWTRDEIYDRWRSSRMRIENPSLFQDDE